MFLVIILKVCFVILGSLGYFNWSDVGREWGDRETAVCSLGEENGMINWCRVRIESMWEAES